MLSKNTKFRIFVDGSYDDKCNVGTVAYNIQNIVIVGNKVININIFNKSFAQKVDCKHSLDSEVKAISLGFDTFKKITYSNPIVKQVPVRVKSDSVPLIKYITKGLWKDDVTFDENLLEDLNKLQKEYKQIRETYPNFKLSYIPSKKNLAHNNAYEMLRWERSIL